MWCGYWVWCYQYGLHMMMMVMHWPVMMVVHDRYWNRSKNWYSYWTYHRLVYWDRLHYTLNEGICHWSY